MIFRMSAQTEPSLTAAPLLPVQRFRPLDLLRRRSIRITLVGWLVVNAVLLALAGGHLPFHASTLATPPTGERLLLTNAMFLEVFVQMTIVHLLTRHRAVPDVAARVPSRSRAKHEVIFMLTYGFVAMLGGFALGRLSGWHAFSFHLDGMVITTGQPISPPEAICWALYNGVVYALIPYLVFRRRYSRVQLGLKSANLRADVLLVVIVLCVESAVQLASADDPILTVSTRQAAVGAPLTFVLSMAGTVLPTMVFVSCILTPRYLRLTGSIPATVILGGLTYALLHFFDGWTTFASPSDALMSFLFLLLFYTGPGMFKTFVTIRTANAWTHVWAYHAIAPHVLLDTPMFVRIFGLR